MAKAKFDDMNKSTVFTRVKSRTAAIKMRDDAKETVQEGKNIVIFFGDRYHLQLAPGQDPYQVRKDIDNFLAGEEEDKSKKKTSSSSKKSK